MTIVELAKRSGLTEDTISCLERNKNNPSLPTLRILAQALNVTIAFLGCFESLPEETFAQKVKKARLYHGLYRKEFAEVLKVEVRSISNWEKNKFKPLPKNRKSLDGYLAILDQSTTHT
jgi:transcriptional regulator with XRE-family HTH domain